MNKVVIIGIIVYVVSQADLKNVDSVNWNWFPKNSTEIKEGVPY